MREAPSRALHRAAAQGRRHGARLRSVADGGSQAHLRRARRTSSLCKNAYEAAGGRGRARIVTEWQEFRSPDFDRLKQLLKTPVIFDGRNLYDPGMVSASASRTTPSDAVRPLRLATDREAPEIMMLDPVILSGGAGTRLWPLSRELIPSSCWR